MSKTLNSQVPDNGANESDHERASAFQIIWPNPSINDNERIQPPSQIVNEFADLAEPLFFHKFLQDHLIDLFSHNFFEGYSKESMIKFADGYFGISDTIFKLEQHSIDQFLNCSIYSFMKHVMRKDDSELRQVDEAIKSIVDKYGSLTNGLHQFTEHADKKASTLNKETV